MGIEQLRQQLRKPDSGRLIIVSAPSGAGKNTIVEGVLKAEGGRVQESISCTTRPRRADEIDGRHYYFRTLTEFQELKQQGGFLETQAFNGNQYGTPLEPLMAPLARGIDVILVIQVAGAHAVMDQVPEALTFFIRPAGDTLEDQLAQLREQLERRAQSTGEEAVSIRQRLEIAKQELPLADSYQYQVENRPGHQEAAVAEFVRLLRQSRAT